MNTATTTKKGTPRPGNGGPRPGAGPKPKFDQPLNVKSFRLTEEQLAYLVKEGDGNATKGLHTLIDYHRQHSLGKSV